MELAELMVGRKLDISSKEAKDHEETESIISIKISEWKCLERE